MASKTTLNAKNLEALGPEKLAQLLIEISMGSAANKRRLRIELAGIQSSGEVAREVAKRLSSIERSRTAISWNRVKPLAKDLETQHRIILGTIAPDDPGEALEVLWRFMGVARSIFERCDDSNGVMTDLFRLACADLGPLAAAAKVDPLALADRAFAAVTRNDFGQFDGLIATLGPALGTDGLARLKAALLAWAQEPVEVPPEHQRKVLGWGPNGPLYRDEFESRQRNTTLRVALEQIAGATGDVDAFIAQQSAAAKTLPSVAAEIAARLLAAGRAQEALIAIDAAELDHDDLIGPDLDWQMARLDVLEALDRKDEAQAFRWACFEKDLSVAHLKAFLKRLPDFDDMEAEDKAFAFAASFPDVHAALEFFVSWPALDRAAVLVVARAGEIDGDFYELLTPAAAQLQDKYQLAAIVLLRAMVDFALEKARSSRYRHAARHLVEAGRLAAGVRDFGAMMPQTAYVAGLRTAHGRKTGFWQYLG